MLQRSQWIALAAGLSMIAWSGCGPADREATRDGKTVIRVEGSDTMVNLAQAWAEIYHANHPQVSIQVLGGGSGVGVASLIDGHCDMANASRKMKDKEIQRVTRRYGKEPQESIVGYDALAVYVHKSNPLESISLEELAEIYGENGTVTDWSQLDAARKAGFRGKITRVSRQAGGGTHTYFRKAVLGKGRDYKLGSIDQNGSKDVVALVSRTPSAIGYSGMGYATPEVKMLKVSRRKAEPGVAPTVQNAKDNSYPITRPLYIYTVGEPAGRVKEYLDWMRSPEGEKVVLELGYVPASAHE
jgi:phosphate transport system substrate-binding protein